MRNVIKITPLQDLLLRKVIPIAEVRQGIARGRVQVWRWVKGLSYPEREIVPVLIQLYAARGHQLDYNGCYIASIELTEEQARDYGLA